MQIVQTIITSDGKKFTDMAKAEAHEGSLTHGATINAWMDHHNMGTGKNGRRKSIVALIAKWEADKASGLLDNIQASVEEAAAAAAAEAPAAEPVTQ